MALLFNFTISFNVLSNYDCFGQQNEYSQLLATPFPGPLLTSSYYGHNLGA